MTSSLPPRRSVLRDAICGGALVAFDSVRGAAAGRPTLSLAAFGGGPDTADNSTALKAGLAALATLGGGSLALGAGLLRFSSTALGQSGLTLPANVALRGISRRETVLLVSGEAPCNFLVAENCSNVILEDLTIVGNNRSALSGTPYGIGAAMRWLLTDAATANVESLTLRRLHLENFRAPFWIEVQNLSVPSRRLAMSGVKVADLTFTSHPGNAVAPADLRVNAAVLCVSGYHGVIRNVHVSRFVGDARHIKSGIILYHRIEGALLDDIRIFAAGREGATDNAGGYAIQLYDSSYRMSGITIADAVIENPRSVGIYVAGATGILVLNARISGQTDQQTGTLPKAAIVFNGTRRWSVQGGALRDNWRDIDIVTPDGGGPEMPEPVASHIVGLISEGSREGVAIRAAAGHVAAGIGVYRCRWRTLERTLLVRNDPEPVSSGPPPTGGYVNDITIADCQLEAGVGFRAVDLWGTSGSRAGGYVLARNVLVGSNPLFAKDQTGSLRITHCLIRDRGTNAGAAAAALLACPDLTLSSCTFESPGSNGVGVDLAGSAGSVNDIRFVRCARQILPGASQLGGARPAFLGSEGQYVQNLAWIRGAPVGWICLGGRNWRPKGARPPNDVKGVDRRPLALR